MNKKKFLFVYFLFGLILLVCFTCLPIKNAHAIELEAKYPTISGQTLTSESQLPDFVLYLFNAGVILGFVIVSLSITISGVLYFLSETSVQAKTEAKDRFYGSLSGLLILILTYLIITTINPQLSIFTLTSLPPSDIEEPSQEKISGVYFYEDPGCSDNDDQSHQVSTTNISDLGPLKNSVNCIEIIQDPDTMTSYITILYDNINFRGKCKYITTSDPDNPNETRQPVAPFALSASIYPYDFDPYGDGGVYFYRKPCIPNQASGDLDDIINYCNQNSGGYYKIPNSKVIGRNYVGNLNKLNFIGTKETISNNNDCNVPLDEQDCIRYYGNSNYCTQRRCPTLAGENISSIIINGNYLVMLVYFGTDDAEEGPWTYCQEFPVPDDINKIGPLQVKWDSIRNLSGKVPNFVIIIPIQR